MLISIPDLVHSHILYLLHIGKEGRDCHMLAKTLPNTEMHDCPGRRCTRQTETDKESQFSVGSLTDWLINPEEYEPVVALEHRKTHSS